MSIDVVNETDVDVDVDRLHEQARFLLERLRIHPDSDLSVRLVDVPVMTELHVRWMEEPGPTDVLSFPMDELRPGRADDVPEPGVLGDVVLCPEVARRQAAAAGHGTDAEIALLLTHGVLHLVGFDHAEPMEHEQMFGLQGELLSAWDDARRTDAG